MHDSSQKKSQKDKGTVRATEVLSFPYAELQKRDNGKNKISEVGIFSVLYFTDYSRYIVYLGDWSYALLRRLPVVAASQTSSDSRCYIFPTYTGEYVVKLKNIWNPESIVNLETILQKNSMFSYEWEKPKQREPSPSDKLTEPEKHEDSQKEKGTSEPGKLRGKEKMKKGFKKIKSKFTSHYSFDRQWNINSMQVRDYFELQSSGVDPTHTHHLGKTDVEAIIARSKDIAESRGYSIDEVKEPPKTKDNKIQVQVQAQTHTQTQAHTKTVAKEPVYFRIEIRETVVKKPEQDSYKVKQADLMEEIENERRLQEIERWHQESHKQRELYHVEKERELQSSIRIQQQEHAARQMHQMEQSLLSEVQHKETILLAQEKLRSEEALAFAKKEKQLQEELDFKFAQLIHKEEVTEAERAELARKETELAQIIKLREAELLALTETQKLLGEQAERRENELKKKMSLTQKERLELEGIKRDLTQSVKLQEEERKNLEIRRRELLREAENREAKILERERLTQSQRLELEMKEMSLEAEHQRRLSELRLKEFLTEQEHLELQRREKELSQLKGMKEIEKVMQDQQKMNKELRDVNQNLPKSDFQTYSKNQDVRQASTGMQKSELKMGEIDVAHRP